MSMSESTVIDDGAAGPGGPGGPSVNGTTGHASPDSASLASASAGANGGAGRTTAASADFAAPEVAGLVTLLTERALAISSAAAQQPSSVRISAGDVQVEICWQSATPVTAIPPWPPAYPAQAAAAWAGPGLAGPPTGAGGADQPAALAAGAAVTAPADGAAAADPGGTAAQQGVFALCAETVGTFYRAPEPGAAPFVTEGDQVGPGQQVGIIEAMKLMIPVEAQRGGRVVELLVADRAPVEYGQPLMLLKEAGQ
jgi:acetyl-CoA carboxylase biotin carboxyl carrier protein